MPIITLLTDFGLRDSYVAEMKGVILGICPEATLIDISHEVAPQQVAEAAYLLTQAISAFPLGTVHLAVVDPGVGGARRVVAAATQQTLLVAPDNGLLQPALQRLGAYRAVALENRAFWRCCTHIGPQRGCAPYPEPSPSGDSKRLSRPGYSAGSISTSRLRSASLRCSSLRT